MASPSSESSKGARRRTGLPTRVRVQPSQENGIGGEDGRDDSGLSSESSTPTNGSPPPRQPRATCTGQVSSSSSGGVVGAIAASSAAATRAKNSPGRIGSDRMSRLLRSRSGTESPRSLDNMRNRQISSPMRTSGSVSSSCVDSGDESSLRIDRGTYQYMFQDIVSIKTMLLKLKRVLQEAETLNPFDNPKNGLFCNLNEGSTTDVSTSPGSGGNSIADELTDLRRQVVFLQGQVEDRDRTIQLRDRTIELLELQISKLQGPKNGDAQNCILPTRNNDISCVDTCNAATQTEKTRPVSAGPSLLQSLPQDGVMGPLVSWSDSSDRQRFSMLSELNSAGSHRKPTERLPHTLRLRQEQTPIRRVNAHARRHSSETLVSGSFTKSKDTAKSPCDSNDAEQRDVKIYTWIDTLLLAINPNGEVSTDDIYDLSRANNLYDNVRITCKEVAPHIFAVAARARYRIVQGLGKPSQVIVLNGETGTGKTFNAWKALEFLTTRNASTDKHRGRDAACCEIVQKITNACRLISAFTVASTGKNETSSRHVELMWLQYKMGNICGAMVSSYLLERNRVTMGHYNFQIFSQMMAALTDIEFADTRLSSDAVYFMSSDLDSSKGQQLRDDFQDTLKAMDMLCFTEDQKKDIFQILSLLIHMSNIQFTQEEDHCRIDTDDQQSKEALENTCKLAGLQKEDITEFLTSTLINPQNSWGRHITCRRNLNTKNTCRYRLHSIIRHLYDLLFHWLINSINRILSVRLFTERLGILDIFGFECFDVNGIEQLGVNYVNERLQQYFMEKCVEFRRKILQEEGLIEDIEPSKTVRLFEDSLNTIEKRLFAPLNDVCLSTVRNDSATLIRQVCANDCPKTRRFLKVKNENFVIQHYAGAVKYSINDLLSKNTDKIPDEITITFGASKNTFLYYLINKTKLHHENGKAKKPTMLSKLRYNVDLLIQELNKCDAHYVRCIKLRRLDNHEWDRNELLRQLSTDILDVLPLARCKYPVHFTYKKFSKRYHCKRNNRRQNIKENTTYRMATIKDELIEKPQVKCISIGIHMYAETYRRQNTRNTACDDQAVDIQDKSIKKNQLEIKCNVPLIDYSFITKPQFIPPNISYNKTEYIIHWLENVSKAMNIKNSGFLISKQSSISYNQLDIESQDARHICSNNNRFHMENRHKNNFEDCNKKEDVYVIWNGTSTLFYKKGILSRRRLAKVNVGIGIMKEIIKKLKKHYYFTATS
ncbi:Myosin-1 [Camponotus floridanus]|uniref:Myosin-1 n=1 Tax=Camponotus floridanus TaxID=104421 RepID=E2AJY3_CAMFO|nr:Myosin-1 [Camponotus floridanus]